jgi:amidase
MKLFSSRVGATLLAALGVASCAKQAPPAVTPYAVYEVTLSQVAADLAAGKTTSVAVAQGYIDRIKKYDDTLHSVLLVSPLALDQARESDQRRAAGKALGPLDGVPILIKDNIDEAGIPTTAGSYAMLKNLPKRDSEVVKRLRAAGVVILGKANLSQWANWRASTAFNGSTVGGPVHNAYDTTRTASGSSSGSGVAASVSFAAATIGTETSGSITGPATVSGDVGLKSTIALVSRRGIVPVGLTQDTAGPMTRSVMDAALLLDVMAGTDPEDPYTADADAHKTSYSQALGSASVKGVRLGVMRGMHSDDPKIKPLFDAALAMLKAQGAELVDIDATKLPDITPLMRKVLLYDFKQDVNAYLSATPPEVTTRTLADLIAFNQSEEHEKLHTQENFVLAQATTGRDDPDYKSTLETLRRHVRAEGLDRLLKDNNVSALVSVTGMPAAVSPPDGKPSSGVTADKPPDAAATSITTYAAAAEYPHLTVPMGVVEGLPVGISFTGPQWSEANLLSYGFAYEQAAHARVAPGEGPYGPKQQPSGGT